MKNNKKWATDAEVAMMGTTIVVENNEHLKFMVDYIRKVLRNSGLVSDIAPAETIIEAVNKYNENNVPVSHFVVNTSAFGVLLTFVRDDEMESITQEDGVLGYVYNLTYPDCSELGIVYFGNERGFIRRIA